MTPAPSITSARWWPVSRILAVADRRDPDFVIGGDSPYLRRWWLIPRNRWFNVYLHQFLRSDDDRALHDHPWAFNLSWLLKGNYLEATPKGVAFLKQGRVKIRVGAAPHRVQLQIEPWPMIPGRIEEVPVWTLFITGPRVRQWGFLCPRGWRHWKDFTGVTPDGRNDGTIGRGCD